MSNRCIQRLFTLFMRFYYIPWNRKHSQHKVFKSHPVHVLYHKNNHTWQRVYNLRWKKPERSFPSWGQQVEIRVSKVCNGNLELLLQRRVKSICNFVQWVTRLFACFGENVGYYCCCEFCKGRFELLCWHAFLTRARLEKVWHLISTFMLSAKKPIKSKPAWNSSTRNKKSPAVINKKKPTPPAVTPAPVLQQSTPLEKEQRKSRNPRVLSLSSTVSSRSSSALSLKDLVNPPPAELKSNPTTTTTTQFETILACRNLTDRELRESQRKLRKMILVDGLAHNNLRARVWKVLLGVYKVSALEYSALVERKECAFYEKIKCDTHRTLATDKKFTDSVSEDAISRILNAFVHKTIDQPVSRLINLKYSYVQGMFVKGLITGMLLRLLFYT